MEQTPLLDCWNAVFQAIREGKIRRKELLQHMGFKRIKGTALWRQGKRQKDLPHDP